MKPFALICFLFISIISYGQTPYFQNFNLPNKNEPTEVHVIFQDDNGFIWIGTNRGLFQFDGFSFTRYSTKDSLPDNQVTAIAEDSLGKIWMGHANGQLSFLHDNKIEKFSPPEGSATLEISDIIFDDKGTLWFSTFNDGLYYYINDRLYRLDEEDGMPDIYIYDLEKGADGQIFAGTDGGLAICTIVHSKANIEVVNHKQGLPDNIIKKIKFIDSETIWLGTQDAGVIKYSLTDKKFEPLLQNWTYGSVSDLSIKQNQVWVTSSQKGAIVIDSKNSSKIHHLPTNDSNNKLLIDQEGGVWIAKKSELTRTPGSEISFIHNFNINTKENIIALTIDQDQTIWFSNEEGLFKIKKNSNTYTQVERVNNPQLKNFPVISLHTDQSGNIWAGSFGNGALLLNTKGEVIHYFNKELKNGNILSICSHGNTVWFATLEGAIRIEVQGKKYSISNYGTKEGLSSDYIYQVFTDSQDRQWFATDGYDIDMLDKNGIHHFKVGDKSKVVYGFAEDNKGVIWANVQGEGLYRMTEKTFVPYKKTKSTVIHSLATDAQGNIVAVNDLGLDIVDPVKDIVLSMGEENGIINTKGNLNSIAKNNLGEIFIGTNAGIILYESSGQIIKNKPKPFIQKIKAGEIEFNNVHNLIIDYDHNNVTVSYLGFWYENPKNLYYQYKLESFDRSWINSKNHEVTYSRLPAGEYTFHLRVSDSDNFENASESIIQFRVKPPFWQQAWFYLFIAALAIYGIYAIIKIREENFQKESYNLKLKVDERTKELQLRNEEILAQAEELQAQSNEIHRINNHLEELVHARTAELEKKNQALEEYAFINAHKLRSPVASILGIVNLMLKLPQPQDLKEHTQHLQKSTKALDEIVSSITKAIEKADEK